MINDLNQKLKSWTVPSDYIPATSQVAGISVYIPISKNKDIQPLKSYMCPQCGAKTQYDVTAGGVACEFCGFVRKIENQIVGRQAESNEFFTDVLAKEKKQKQESSFGWGAELSELHCDNCGANLVVGARDITTTCPFCASNKVNVRTSTTEQQIRPQFLIPFKIQPKTNQERVRAWLGKGWFHPKELKVSSVINRFSGLYIPFWTFSAHVRSIWKAEVGYEHEERYYDSGSKEWKTRTEIRWRWENGDVAIQIQDWLVMGTSNISQHIISKVYPFYLNDLVPYSSDFLAGWNAKSYDVNLQPAWEEGKTAMREKAKTACDNSIKSSHVRNFSMAADFSNESWRFILLPLYIAAYQFEAKVYQVMVNGQTGTISGQKPVAWWKIWLAVLGILSPGLILGFISFPLLFLGGSGAVTGFIAFILLVIGGIFSVILYQQAQSSEAG